MKSLTNPSTEPALPLTPAVFHILLALSEGELHGYAIMQAVTKQTEGNLSMGPGTLYGSIKRMLAAGIVSESDVRPDPSLDDERRRYYRITVLGEKVLHVEVTRMAKLMNSEAMKRILERGLPEITLGGNA